MANIQLLCPGCGQTLRVPESFQGRRVKCPRCERAFTAPAEEPADETVAVAEEAVDQEDDQDWEDEEFEEPRPRRRRRRRKAPHRGTLVLTLGILSFVVMPVILGPMAWILGHHDLNEMRAGRMDRSGESSTNTGRICGMISTLLGATCCLGYGVLVLVAGLVPFLQKAAH